MKRLPAIGSLAHYNGVLVKVLRIYSNGNMASTIGVVEYPIVIESMAFEVFKEELS